MFKNEKERLAYKESLAYEQKRYKDNMEWVKGIRDKRNRVRRIFSNKTFIYFSEVNLS